jgi:transcriptional regulator with XRE-family HTH domain
MTVEFAQRLRRDMGALSQRDLGSISGMNHSNISRLLRGNRNATPKVAEKLMKALEIPPADQADFLLTAAGHSRAVVEAATGKGRIQTRTDTRQFGGRTSRRRS